MPIFIFHHDLIQFSKNRLIELYENNSEKNNSCFKVLTYWIEEKKNLFFILFESTDESIIKTFIQKNLQLKAEHILEVNNYLSDLCLNQKPYKEIGIKSVKGLNVQLNKIFVALYLPPIVSDTGFSDIKPMNNIILSNLIKIIQIISDHKGKIIVNKKHCLICTFDNLKNAIKSVFNIRLHFFTLLKNDIRNSTTSFKIKTGISVYKIHNSNFPITDNITNEVRNLAFLSDKSQIVITGKIYSLLKHEGFELTEKFKRIRILSFEEEEFIHRFFDVLDKKLKAMDFDILSLAKDLGFSKSTLYRTIVSITGLSPQLFINEYKLIKSLSLLEEGRLNISEVAFESGFGSPSYFSKSFKNYYGITPSAYLA